MTNLTAEFPDKVALLEDGWAVRFHGCIEQARWQSKGAALAHLTNLQSGYQAPMPEPMPPTRFNKSLFE